MHTLTPGSLHDFFQDQGFVWARGLLKPSEFPARQAAISRQVERRSTEALPFAERSTYGKAFLQCFNLWREDPVIQSLVFDQHLARLAAEILGVRGVRLYHDQALFKEPGGGITPWHADQHYWPLASNKTVTAWIPLQDTPLEMGPLAFAAGSQSLLAGRNLSIGDDSERIMQERFRLGDFPHMVEPYALGDVSFHSGWVFHRAGANTTAAVRRVMTVIYMDINMRLKEPENSGQANDAKTWCPGVQPGAIIDTPLNPVLYSE